jgi:hypothetical protein
MTLKIDKNVPIPSADSKTLNIAARLEIGDSVLFVGDGEFPLPCSRAEYFKTCAKKHGFKTIKRRDYEAEPEHVIDSSWVCYRVWRIE